MEWLSPQGNSIVNAQQGYRPADTMIASDAQNSFDPDILSTNLVDPYATQAGIPGPYPTAPGSFGPYPTFIGSFDSHPSQASSPGPYPPDAIFFVPESYNFGSPGLSMAPQSTNTGGFPFGGQNPSTSVVATPPVGLSLSGPQVPIVGYGLYNEYNIPMSSQSPSSFIPTASWAQAPNSGAYLEGSGTYFPSLINQSPTSLDSDPLLDPGDAGIPGPQGVVTGMYAQQIHGPAHMMIAGDAQNSFHPDIVSTNPVYPYATHANVPGPHPSQTSSSGRYPPDARFFGPRSSNSGSSSLFMAPQSTNSSRFSSIGGSASASVGATHFVDSSPTHEQIPDVGPGLYNDSHVSMLSRAADAPPNFVSTTTGAQVSDIFPFHRNSGAIQEGYGTYFSSKVNQSSISFDCDRFLDTGGASTSGPKEVPVGPAHVISDAQVSSNVAAPRRRPSNRPESPLPKGLNGYVEIEAAWDRLLKKPPLPTKDFDAFFFPSDQASVPVGPLDKGGRICKVKASVTETGPAEWIPNPSDKPCGAELKTGDSYRRHIINQHLSCARGPSAKQKDWIEERRLDVVGSDTH